MLLVLRFHLCFTFLNFLWKMAVFKSLWIFNMRLNVYVCVLRQEILIKLMGFLIKVTTESVVVCVGKILVFACFHIQILYISATESLRCIFNSIALQLSTFRRFPFWQNSCGKLALNRLLRCFRHHIHATTYRSPRHLKRQFSYLFAFKV